MGEVVEVAIRVPAEGLSYHFSVFALVGKLAVIAPEPQNVVLDIEGIFGFGLTVPTIATRLTGSVSHPVALLSDPIQKVVVEVR
jgi:hypothetical protein